jgi:hypothetical protein
MDNLLYLLFESDYNDKESFIRYENFLNEASACWNITNYTGQYMTGSYKICPCSKEDRTGHKVIQGY